MAKIKEANEEYISPKEKKQRKLKIKHFGNLVLLASKIIFKNNNPNIIDKSRRHNFKAYIKTIRYKK